MMKPLLPVLAAAAAALAVPGRAAAADDVPYWASLTADTVNMRVGPARDYKIAWLYKRKLLPVKVVRLHEGWRLVEDPDGARGWILSRFLSRKRTALVTAGADLRSAPGGAQRLWRVERGVVGTLGDCRGGWCRFDTNGHAGWIRADAVWGDGAA